MKAVFSLIDKAGTRVSEDLLRDDRARAAALLGNLRRSEAVLHIEGADGETWASLGDTLPVLMDNFCLEGLDTLRADKRLEVDFFDHEEQLTATVADGTVTLESTRFGRRSFPEAEYFVALAACGQRYQSLLDAMRDTDEETGTSPP